MTHNHKISRRRQLDDGQALPLKKSKVLKFFRMEANAKAKEETTGAAQTASTVTLDPDSDFYNTGRVGRRNALPDILNHQHVNTSTADLPSRLSALTTKEDPETGPNAASTSSANDQQKSANG